MISLVSTKHVLNPQQNLVNLVCHNLRVQVAEGCCHKINFHQYCGK